MSEISAVLATVTVTALGTTITLPTTFLGLAAGTWTTVGIVTGVTSGVLSLALGITEAEADEAIKGTKNFVAGANKRLAPGETYTYSDSLSMTRTVWLMNENAEQVLEFIFTIS